MEYGINTTVDDVFRSSPTGSINRAIGNVFYGINHQQTPSAVPINKDVYGLTFFVRPQLNLTTNNIRAERQFVPLATTEEQSIQRIVRNYLDPRLADSDRGLRSPFVDNKNPFIPLLTNHLLSCSGWPDPVIETYTSKKGVYGETFGYTDSQIDKYSSFDLTCSFRNMSGDPISLMLYTWILYMGNVFENVMSPYPDFIVRNTIDYNTRIYRLILDKNKKYVQKIACCGTAQPISVDYGGNFNFEHDKLMNMSNENISINFRCYGYRYNDDINIKDFNSTVGIFNPDMRTKNRIDKQMVKIPSEAMTFFNNRGYPRINPSSYELEWYVDRETYVNIMSAYNRHNRAMSNETLPIENLTDSNNLALNSRNNLSDFLA